MSLFKDIFYCSECKKNVPELEGLLFVENDGQNGFCSETCIEKFYTPFVDGHEEQEKKWREQNNLEEEDVLDVVGHPAFMDRLLRTPDEVYHNITGTDANIYSFISQIENSDYGKFWMMCLCLVYDNQPSFIITASATKSKELVNQYRWGEPVEDVHEYHSQGESKKKQSHLEIDEQTVMEVEGKKSRYLAELLTTRSPADIGFESFGLYEQYFEPTMLEPDEIYLDTDDEGDSIFTYIKAHDREGVSFYYFIVCLRVKEKMEKNPDALIPIVSFPSVDGEVYRSYRKGELISGNLKN